MQDYYFCEQCQTYHHPNRIINGQILSACECSILTQSTITSRIDNAIDIQTQQINTKCTKNYNVSQQIKNNTINNVQNNVTIKRLQQATSQIYKSYHSECNNKNQQLLPRQNYKHNIKQIVINNFLAQQAKVSIIFPSKINKKIINQCISSSTQDKVNPYQNNIVNPLSRFVVNKQEIKPSKISIKAPYQTQNNNFNSYDGSNTAGNIKNQYQTNFQLNSLPEPKEVAEPIKIYKKPSTHQNLQNRVTLNRISGQTIANNQFYQQNCRIQLERVIQDRKFFALGLDRVIQHKNVDAQIDSKNLCCQKLYYF